LICRMLIDSFEGWQGYGYPNWQDYIYELVGVPPRAAPTSPLEAPRITWRDAMSPDPVSVIALRRRVYCKGTPIYVEARWNPTTGETEISMHGLHKDHRKTSVDQAFRGIILLEALEVKAGRRAGTGYYPTQDAFHAAYLRAAAEAQRRRGARVRDEDIARALGISRSQFYREVHCHSRPVLPGN
jgi:hypothetical protein